ncbi:hypothetical protein BaRGS_00036148 [Batillaria attramentaria]|uniref:Uncharacterized protein n=1 Tax=Batillaria attramentaria TaxID=370345 RepID=A0ABD0JCH6_9CAEN
MPSKTLISNKQCNNTKLSATGGDDCCHSNALHSIQAQHDVNQTHITPFPPHQQTEVTCVTVCTAVEYRQRHFQRLPLPPAGLMMHTRRIMCELDVS